MEGQIPELVRDENSASRLPEIIVSDFRDMTEIFHDGRDRDSGVLPGFLIVKIAVEIVAVESVRALLQEVQDGAGHLRGGGEQQGRGGAGPTRIELRKLFAVIRIVVLFELDQAEKAAVFFTCVHESRAPLCPDEPVGTFLDEWHIEKPDESVFREVREECVGEVECRLAMVDRDEIAVGIVAVQEQKPAAVADDLNRPFEVFAREVVPENPPVAPEDFRRPLDIRHVENLAFFFGHELEKASEHGVEIERGVPFREMRHKQFDMNDECGFFLDLRSIGDESSAALRRLEEPFAEEFAHRPVDRRARDAVTFDEFFTRREFVAGFQDALPEHRMELVDDLLIFWYKPGFRSHDPPFVLVLIIIKNERLSRLQKNIF